MANFRLIILTIFGVHSSLIWDPECEGKECSGSPDRGDEVTSFDDWDGFTRTYGTKITYTCAEGFAFDLKGFPSKIENYCGKMCEGWSIGSQKKCFLSQDKSDQAGCRISGPEWSNKDGKLPRCVLPHIRWKKSVGNNSIFWPLFKTYLLSAVCDSAELPTVSNSFTYASSTDLEVGTRATIQCYRGYHFPGAPVAINTPVPTLPTTTAPPIPDSRESFIKSFPSFPTQWFNTFLRMVVTGGGSTMAPILIGSKRCLKPTRTTAVQHVFKQTPSSPISATG